MLLRIDNDRVIFSGHLYRDPPGVRVLDRHGRETRFDLGERFANFRQAPDGALLLRHDTGVAIVDPHSQVAMRELNETELADDEASWSVSFFDALVDPQRGYFAGFELDDAALSHDPETGPTDALLMSDRRSLVITIHKTSHVVIFDPVARTTKLLPLTAVYGGASKAIVVGSDLWFVCYDRFCCLDFTTGAFRASEALQPQFCDAETRFMMSGFGACRVFHSRCRIGWCLAPIAATSSSCRGRALRPSHASLPVGDPTTPWSSTTGRSWSWTTPLM